MMKESSQEDAIRDHDIQALLEAGVSMMALEDLYGPKAVHRVAETYITSHVPTDDDDDNKKQDDQKSKLATLLFLRAPSSSTKARIRKSQHNVVDAVFAALVADPEDPLLMDPLLHTVLHDPVVLSSGIVLDRSTAMDPRAPDQLRLAKCPFRRIPLKLPVYELYPLQEKIRAYEHERLARCVSVAQTFMTEEDYDRAERVFEIAHDFLQEHQRNYDQRQSSTPRDSSIRMEDCNKLFAMIAAARGNAHGNSNQQQTKEGVQQGAGVSTSGTLMSQKHYTREILLLALQLAQLERELPQAKEDISRIVAIHRRLIQVARACSADQQDTETLVIACLEDCWKRCSLILAFAAEGSTEASHRALLIRRAFSPLITYTQLLQLKLTEELQKLCQLDLRLAKDVEDEPAIWNCRRMLWKILPEAEKASFLESEGIEGNEKDLYYHLVYDTSAWPNEKFMDPSIGLTHFGTSNTPGKSSQNEITGPLPMTQTRGITCWVNLNPVQKGDHWIEVAFCPDIMQSPGYPNPILSQYSSDAGWEIRCVVVPALKLPFGIGGEKREPGIYVESVWTTTNGDNSITNNKVPLEIGNWYHILLAYCNETSTISLYVNGLPVRQKVGGVFIPAKGSPRLGESMQWMDRRLQGWTAFGGGGYELPIQGKDTSALDGHVQTLAKARLAELPTSSALRKLYSVEGGDRARLADEEMLGSFVVRKNNSINESGSSWDDDDPGGSDNENEND